MVSIADSIGMLLTYEIAKKEKKVKEKRKGKRKGIAELVQMLWEVFYLL